MAYNISSLSIYRGETIKADKINFLIDYVRKLKSDVGSNSSSIGDMSSDLSRIFSELNRLSNKIEELKPKSATIIDLDGRLPKRVPSGRNMNVSCYILYW